MTSVEAVTNGSAVAPPELDLDAIVGAIDVEPQSVRLGGRTYQVRRNLRWADVREFDRLAALKDDLGALALVVGPGDAATFNSALEGLPSVAAQAVLARVLALAGVRGGDQGGASAL